MKKTHPFKGPIPGGSIKEKRVNPDLLEERAKQAFDKEELLEAVTDPELFKKARECIDDLYEHPELKSTAEFFDMSREE